MQKFRIGLGVFAFIWMILQITQLNFEQLDWITNKGAYSGIIAMAFVILSMILSYRAVKKKEMGDK